MTRKHIWSLTPVFTKSSSQLVMGDAGILPFSLGVVCEKTVLLNFPETKLHKAMLLHLACSPTRDLEQGEVTGRADIKVASLSLLPLQQKPTPSNSPQTKTGGTESLGNPCTPSGTVSPPWKHSLAKDGGRYQTTTTHEELLVHTQRDGCICLLPLHPLQDTLAHLNFGAPESQLLNSY